MSATTDIRTHLCRRLRSKGMYVDAPVDPTVPNMSDGFRWCTHTMNCMGPDGRVADDHNCRPGRICYEAV
jgi:hypothetical protein